jgi:hypothetical protein
MMGEEMPFLACFLQAPFEGEGARLRQNFAREKKKVC